MEEEIINKIIVAIYLKRYQLGYYEISLTVDDMMDYVPKLTKLFKKEGLISTIFTKFSPTDTYFDFKIFLISYFLGMNLGYMNKEYNKLILSIDEQYIKEELKLMSSYQKIIDEGCQLLEDNKIIDKNKVHIIKVN